MFNSYFYRNLKDMDVLSKSDPMLVLYTLEGSNWREFGRTEMIKYVKFLF